MIKKICFFTGSRAEYGLLKPLINKCNLHFDVNLIVSGTHLSNEFGLTYKEIERDNIKITEKIEILLSSDTSIGVSKSFGLGMISFSEALNRIKPDMCIILGDRYETFAFAICCSILKIPLAHLHGGELTEGAFDEGFRHSITKLSHLHFTSTEEYRKRVIQLGEEPERVFNVGAIGLDNIKNLNLLSLQELSSILNFDLSEKYFIVTFHPITLENSTSKLQIIELFKALDEFKEYKIIFTKSNADTEGRIINEMIDDYCSKNINRVRSFENLGQLKYLSALKYCSAIIGNSSSGIIEAPSFKIPTINIGDRQKGRLHNESVINCSPVAEDIIKSIKKALSEDFKLILKNTRNIYGDGNTSEKIVNILINISHISLKKKFFDIKLNI